MGATNRFIALLIPAGRGWGALKDNYALVQKSFSFMTLILFTLHTELTNFSS